MPDLQQTLCNRAVYLLDVATAARAAADKAADARKAWTKWDSAGAMYWPTGGVGGSAGYPTKPPRPDEPRPTDETEDVLRRLADALEAMAGMMMP